MANYRHGKKARGAYACPVCGEHAVMYFVLGPMQLLGFYYVECSGRARCMRGVPELQVSTAIGNWNVEVKDFERFYWSRPVGRLYSLRRLWASGYRNMYFQRERSRLQ